VTSALLPERNSPREVERVFSPEESIKTPPTDVLMSQVGGWVFPGRFDSSG